MNKIKKFNKYNFIKEVFVYIEKTPKAIISIFPIFTKISLSFPPINKISKKIFLLILLLFLSLNFPILIAILFIISLYSLFNISGSEKIIYPFELNKNNGFFSKIETVISEKDSVERTKEEVVSTFRSLDENNFVDESYAEMRVK